MAKDRIALFFKPSIRNRLLVSVLPLLVLPVLVLGLFAYFIARAQVQEQLLSALDSYKQDMLELTRQLEEEGLQTYLQGAHLSSPQARVTQKTGLQAGLALYLDRHRDRFPSSLAIKAFDSKGVQFITFLPAPNDDFVVDKQFLEKSAAVPDKQIYYEYRGGSCICGLPIYPKKEDDLESKPALLGVMVARFPYPKLPSILSLDNPAVLAVVVSTVVGLMVTVLVVVRINSLMQPIVRLAGAAQLAARGDVAVSFDTGSADEIGQLAQAFSGMSAELSRYISELAELNRDLETKVEARTIELQQANKLKSEFLANVTHETRTPLNSILTLCDMLLRELPGRLNDDQQKQLTMIRNNGQRLLELIDGIIELSQLETGAVKLQLKPIRLGALVSSIASAFEPLARNKGVKLSLELPPDLPPAYGDENRLKEIFAHLLNNAVKFTEKGHITVSCRACTGENAEARRGRLECTVSDTGIGIPPDQQQAIFDRFRQLDGAATRKFPGTGLGLALAKNLVEVMGGRIWLESAPGKGSTFTFTIPVFQGEEELDDRQS